LVLLPELPTEQDKADRIALRLRDLRQRPDNELTQRWCLKIATCEREIARKEPIK
jgi:hypothetical protein